MAMDIEVSIPIRGVFKQFITRMYGAEPFVVRVKDNNIARYMRFLFVSSDLKGQDIYTDTRFNDRLRIQVPFDIADQGRFMISSRHVAHLDRFLKTEFEKELHRNILIGERFMCDHKDIVDSFIEHYDLGDHVEAASLLKQFRRKHSTKASRNTLKRDILKKDTTRKTA